MGIHLRRVTEAIVPDNSITKEKFATGAIELDTDKVTGLLPNAKLGQIEDVAKIKDNILTLAKMQDDVKIDSYTGGEEPQSIIGIEETWLVDTEFAIIPNMYAPKKVKIACSLKVEGLSGSIAYLKVYFDDEVEARLAFETGNDVYEFLSNSTDISDLTNGRHKITIKGNTNQETAKCWNDYIDIYFVK